MEVIRCVPPPLTLHIFRIVFHYLSLIIIAFVWNQSLGHWLFYNALHVAITMSLKLRGKTKNLAFMNNVMKIDYKIDLELMLLASNVLYLYICWLQTNYFKNLIFMNKN
jgi:hypothetical protein